MAVNTYWIEDDAILVVEYAGLVRYDQVKSAYQQVVDMEPSKVRYILVDGMEMMMETPDLFASEELGVMINAVVGRESFKRIAFIIRDDHPLMALADSRYTQLGLRHKVEFVDTYEAGVQLLKGLIAAETS